MVHPYVDIHDCGDLTLESADEGEGGLTSSRFPGQPQGEQEVIRTSCMRATIEDIASRTANQYYTSADLKGIVDTAYLMAVHDWLAVHKEVEEDVVNDSEVPYSEGTMEGTVHKAETLSSTRRASARPVVIIKPSHLVIAFERSSPSMTKEAVDYFHRIHVGYKGEQTSTSTRQKAKVPYFTVLYWI